ncbi:MAG: DNA-3-methyladenine glycosylase 2, partial [Luteolibacter sp.]
MEGFTLQLPKFYQTAEVMSFHGRDREGFAETISSHQIRKGLLIDEVPTILTLSLKNDQAVCQISD